MTLDSYADLFDDDLDYVAQALSRARDSQRTIMIGETDYGPPTSLRRWAEIEPGQHSR